MKDSTTNDELSMAQKIEEIKHTAQLGDVQNAWLPPCHEKEYYFVSYCRRDYKLVYEELHKLQVDGKVSLWYDRALIPGSDWEISAKNHIYDYNCKGIIFFLSENAVCSSSVQKEMQFAKASGKAFMSVNLPCSRITGREGEYLDGASMLQALHDRGEQIEDFDGKLQILNDMFNDKVIYLCHNANIDDQIEKILSLKRQPLLVIDKDGRVMGINDSNVEEIKVEDFCYARKIYFDDEDDEQVEERIAHSMLPCAFANCRRLRTIDLPEYLVEIAPYCFYHCSNLTKIAIPDGFDIGDYAFSRCESLPSITIPDGVEAIGGGAFYGCESLKSVKFGSNSELTVIGNKAFSDCKSLTNITIPDGVKSIGYRAFNCCESLKSVKFGSNSKLTVIGEEAFCGCESLKSVKFGSNSKLTVIGESAFYGGKTLTNIKIPDGVKSVGKSAFGYCKSLKSVEFGANSELTSIGDYAFSGCESLTNITIPDGVKSIGRSAFSGCHNLANIAIPNGVESIGYRVFSGCYNLTNIAISSKVKSIGDDAFCGCKSLPSITISDRVVSIGNQVFAFCKSLTNITIFDGVKSIGYYAFDCCENLKDIYYKGSMQQWISIEKGELWDRSTPNYVVHCVDGDLHKGEF